MVRGIAMMKALICNTLRKRLLKWSNISVKKYQNSPKFGVKSEASKLEAKPKHDTSTYDMTATGCIHTSYEYPFKDFILPPPHSHTHTHTKVSHCLVGGTHILN